MHAVSRRVHQDSTRPVNDISSGNLLAPSLQAIHQAPTAIARHSSVDGKNRPDRDVHVDIGGSIQRIEKHYILSRGGIGRNGILFFLRRHERDTSRVAKGLLHYLIRQHVEFLLLLALYVDCPCGTQDVHQPRAAYVARYYFGGEGDVIEKVREFSGRLWVQAFLPHDEALNGNHLRNTQRTLSMRLGDRPCMTSK